MPSIIGPGQPVPEPNPAAGLTQAVTSHTRRADRNRSARFDSRPDARLYNRGHD